MTTLTPARGLQDQIIEEIRVMMVRRRLGVRQLADILGWAPSGLSRRLSGQIQITITDLEEIARALDVSVGDLLPGVITRREWSSRRLRAA